MLFTGEGKPIDNAMLTAFVVHGSTKIIMLNVAVAVKI